MEEDTVSDEELMCRFCRTLDDDLFEQLVNRYMRSALLMAESRLQDRATAQDAVQETLLRIVRDRGRFRADGNFSGWLFTILRNICTDHQRRQSAYREKISHLAERVESYDVVRGKRLSWQDLEILAEDERDVLILRLVQGMTFAEIASAAGCSVEAAKKRAQRAIARLRRLLPE